MAVAETSLSRNESGLQLGREGFTLTKQCSLSDETGSIVAECLRNLRVCFLSSRHSTFMLRRYVSRTKKANIDHHQEQRLNFALGSNACWPIIPDFQDKGSLNALPHRHNFRGPNREPRYSAPSTEPPASPCCFWASSIALRVSSARFARASARFLRRSSCNCSLPSSSM